MLDKGLLDWRENTTTVLLAGPFSISSSIGPLCAAFWCSLCLVQMFPVFMTTQNFTVPIFHPQNTSILISVGDLVLNSVPAINLCITSCLKQRTLALSERCLSLLTHNIIEWQTKTIWQKLISNLTSATIRSEPLLRIVEQCTKR